MYKQGNARGTGEVRRGTSSIHFHFPAPRSSSHIGHGVFAAVLDNSASGIPLAGQADLNDSYSYVYFLLWESHGFLHFPNVPCTQTCLPAW